MIMIVHSLARQLVSGLTISSTERMERGFRLVEDADIEAQGSANGPGLRPVRKEVEFGKKVAEE